MWIFMGIFGMFFSYYLNGNLNGDCQQKSRLQVRRVRHRPGEISHSSYWCLCRWLSGKCKKKIISGVKNNQSVPGSFERVWNITGHKKICMDSRWLHRTMKKRCCFIPSCTEDLISDHILDKCSVILHSRETLAYMNFKEKVTPTGYEGNPVSSKDAKLSFTGHASEGNPEGASTCCCNPKKMKKKLRKSEKKFQSWNLVSLQYSAR